jgi:hypothetical protein
MECQSFFKNKKLKIIKLKKKLNFRIKSPLFFYLKLTVAVFC